VSKLHLAWRAGGALAAPWRLVNSGMLESWPGHAVAAARLMLAAGGADRAEADRQALGSAASPEQALLARQPDARVCVFLDPNAMSLMAAVQAGVLHFWRLADATTRPLPAAAGPLQCQRGDAYVAVAQHEAGAPAGYGLALARFIHLRDYFNADKLAQAILEHLDVLDQEYGWDSRAGVLVVEVR
jgi:hypothetical protein